jgi:glycosyltransferase involved in cell wall biosynthesis
MHVNCPAISAIIPTYNRADRLKGALESVLAQTLKVYEIIVVDDGSTDSTRSVVETLGLRAEQDIMYLRQSNRGPAAARNLGIREAGGDLLAFLDSDDRWLTRKLEIQVAAMQEDLEVLVSHTREKWYRSGVHLNQKKKHQPPDGSIFDHCLPLCCVGMSTVVIRPSFFAKHGYFDEKLRCCEDYDMWLRSAHSERFLLVPAELTIKHGGRSDQVSSRYRTGMDRFRIQSLASLWLNTSVTPQQKVLLSREIDRKCRIYGNGCIKHGKRLEGEYYLRLANCFGQDD